MRWIQSQSVLQAFLTANRERIEKSIEKGEEHLAGGEESKTLDDVEDDDLDEIREGYWHP